MQGEKNPHWILFLKKDIRPGAPELTWLEVGDTGFMGHGCGTRLEDFPEDQRADYERMLSRKNALGNSGQN